MAKKGLRCSECDYRFADNLRGKVKCPECLTTSCIISKDDKVMVVEVNHLLKSKPKQEPVKSTRTVFKKRTYLGPITQEPVTPQQLCLVCTKEIQSVSSVPAKVNVAFARRWEQVEGDEIVPYDADHDQVLAVETYREKVFPIIKKGRICSGCVTHKSVTEVLPEWDKGELRPAERKCQTYPGRSFTSNEKAIDPGWMTSRGKRF